MIVGKSVPRKDAQTKANGEAKYIYDISLPDEHHLTIVRSPHPHARIKKIDINWQKINQLNATVGTSKDIPGKNVIQVMYDDWPLLAENTVYHVGQPVAIVVAKTPEKAKEAASYIRIEYEPIPPVFDPIEAMDHPTIRIFGENNVCSTWKQRKGDVEQGFSESDVIVEEEYHTHVQEHAYIETQGCIAVPTGHEEITVYGSMQSPFTVRKAVADSLGYSLGKVTITQTVTGGAFGGKGDDPKQIASLAALGTYLTKKPVKCILSREEDMETTSKRHPAVIRMKTGATKNGLLTSSTVDFYLNAGAFVTISPSILSKGAMLAPGPYNVPHVNVQGYAIITNLVPFDAFRGFGAPQILFACEEQIDRISAKLNMDPIRFREKNIIKKGDRTTHSQLIDHSAGLHETLTVARERSNWNNKWKPAPNIQHVIDESNKGRTIWKGIGVSTTFYGLGFGHSGKVSSRTSAYIQLESDGSAVFTVGTTEMGQGMMTVLSQIISEELGIDYEKIRMTPIDTSKVPDSGATVASRTTMFSGRAIQDACRKLRKIIFKTIASRISSDVSELKIDGKNIVDINNDSKKISVEDAIKIMYENRIQPAVVGWDVAPDTYYDYETGKGKPKVVYAWGTNIVEVEVDVQTGVVEIKDIWAVHDVGKAINPQTVEGQIEGGSIQGLGYGRFEEIVFSDNGEVLTNSLGTYMIPTIMDAPNIHLTIVEHPWNEGPYGAKGVGEPPLIGIAPAITSAIYNAIGVRLNEIPATPERVWQAIQENILEAAQ